MNLIRDQRLNPRKLSTPSFEAPVRPVSFFPQDSKSTLGKLGHKQAARRRLTQGKTTQMGTRADLFSLRRIMQVNGRCLHFSKLHCGTMQGYFGLHCRIFYSMLLQVCKVITLFLRGSHHRVSRPTNGRGKEVQCCLPHGPQLR